MSHRRTRQSTIATVADDIAKTAGRSVTTLVAVDGVDGAGKTYFAGELTDALAARDLSVVRASVDGFHNPPEVRYRRGRDSPDGFFHDSYDYDAFRERLLDPLRSGTGDFVRAVYDVRRETAVELDHERAGRGDVLVVDGIFLHRPELRDSWDYSVFLDVAFAVSVPRGARRGYGDPDPASETNRRYVEGQRIYLSTCRPREHATVVIDNSDLAGAHIVRRNAMDGSNAPRRAR